MYQLLILAKNKMDSTRRKILIDCYKTKMLMVANFWFIIFAQRYFIFEYDNRQLSQQKSNNSKHGIETIFPIQIV